MENPNIPVPESIPDPTKNRSSSQNILIFLGGIIFVLALAGVAFTIFKSTNNTPKNANRPSADQTKPLDLAPYTMVYGTWDSNGSAIKAFDLQSGKNYLVANLPSNVKEVSVLDNDRLLYIDNTDAQDHGTQLSIYSIKEKKSTPILKASDNFGIDEYTLSPNKQYVSDWEVTASSSGALYGGKSRVYTAKLSDRSTNKHLIYDEVANNPVHYPRGILDNGTVYTDTFLPNSGAGWAYGMSVSNFDGSQKQDLANMQNGTYGTQPELSPDGKYFVFAGYDGSKGDGTTELNSFRQALVSPDTIELLDTTTNQRTKLTGINTSYSYPAVSWDNTGDSILYTQLGSTVNTMGTYTYNISSKKSQKVKDTSTTQTVLTEVTKNDFLIGQTGDTTSNLGNLGLAYAPAISDLGMLDTNTQNLFPLPLTDPLAQFISIEPTDYFAQTASTETLIPGQTNQQLQLQTFVMKPSLAPIREGQQSSRRTTMDSSDIIITPVPTSSGGGRGCNPPGITGGGLQPCASNPPSKNAGCTIDTCQRCYEIEDEQCGGTNDVQTVYNADQEACKSAATRNTPCFDSPLYLYGPSGIKVQVKIITPVSNNIPAYNNGYNVTLSDNGTLLINGRSYDKISYDYISALKRITPPTYGTITTQDNLEQTLTMYANKLGLNKKETNDLISDSLAKITSPYVFVSFFDNNTSKSILPISFSPQPDVYRNIVFYFKQLNSKPNYTPVPPTFEKIQRHGFTAIEISEMVDSD